MATDGFAQRLSVALETKKLTQGQLAALIEVSQPLVSQWLKGEKDPGREPLGKLALVLGTSVDWLLTGEGEAPEPELTEQRKEYQQQVDWAFRPEPLDGGRDFGNANLWTLGWDINALGREAGQNIKDEALDPTIGAEAEFRLIRLTGKDLEDFQRALKWHSNGNLPGLKDHLDAAANSGQKLGTILRDGLDDVEARKELLLLRVDDSRTGGLTGPEFGDGNFAALCRNNLHSDKEGPAAGGSYGLGKAVFWRASRFATVLFRSNLSRPEKDELGQLRHHGRIIGRSDLSWHQFMDGTAYAGPGWFGHIDQSKGVPIARSSWENLALARDLYLDRDDDEGFGTSILVVGFHDPSSDTPRNMQDLARDIQKAIARNFWPALESGRFKVRVSTYEGGQHDPNSSNVISADADAPTAPFVVALRAYRKGEFKDQLAAPGDVTETRITLKIPRRKARLDPHPEMQHDAVLLIRRAREDEDVSLVGRVAYFRGREMVIKYDNMTIPGSFPFHAVVLCGEATGDAVDDLNAERFLRTAEPPAHDDWKVTPELKAEYAPGGGKAVQDFFSRVREEIRRQVRPQVKDLNEGPEGLRDLLRISGTIPPPPPRPSILRPSGSVDRDGRWNIRGRIRVPNTGATWHVTPVLIFAAETGGGTTVNWLEKGLEVDQPCRVEDGEIIIPPGTREVPFRGISDPSSHPVPANECAVRVDLRNPRRVD